jgi:hypothetical protein
MTWAACGAPNPVAFATLQMVSGLVPSCGVTSPASHACEGSIVWRCTVELHCSALSTCLVGYDDVACSHIVQAPW